MNLRLHAADVELPQSRDLLLAVSRFLAPGNSLVIFTTGNGNELLARADALGWEAFVAAGDGRKPEGGARTPSRNRRNVSREQRRSDAAVVVRLVEEGTDDLAAARAHVNVEAVIAVRATSAELAYAALTATGFRMVEWIPASSERPNLRSVLRPPSAGIAVARPV